MRQKPVISTSSNLPPVLSHSYHWFYLRSDVSSCQGHKISSQPPTSLTGRWYKSTRGRTGWTATCISTLLHWLAGSVFAISRGGVTSLSFSSGNLQLRLGPSSCFAFSSLCPSGNVPVPMRRHIAECCHSKSPASWTVPPCQ